MCERIAQYRLKQVYAEAMGWPAVPFEDNACDRIANWNVPPGSQPWLMHRLRGRQPRIDMVNWGYRPAWAAHAGIPLATRVRFDQALLGPYFKSLVTTGRAVVPVDGWYEWTKADDVRQPWFVQRKTRHPFFLAAISSFRPHRAAIDDSGFIIVCDSTDGGIVNPVEQRPIVMDAHTAACWINPDIRLEEAAEAAHACRINREEFEWFKVTLDVNRYASNGCDLITPLTVHGRRS